MNNTELLKLTNDMKNWIDRNPDASKFEMIDKLSDMLVAALKEDEEYVKEMTEIFADVSIIGNKINNADFSFGDIVAGVNKKNTNIHEEAVTEHVDKVGKEFGEYIVKNCREEMAVAIVSAIDTMIRGRDYGADPIKKANGYIYSKLHHYIEDLQEDSFLNEEILDAVDRLIFEYYHWLLDHTAGCQSFKRYCEYACSFAIMMDETIKPCIYHLRTYNIRI